MPFSDVKAKWRETYANNVPQRFRDLDAYDKMLEGTFYDILKFPFTMERNGTDKVPIYERRPSVQYSLPQMLAGQQAALLFGDDHRPSLKCYDPNNSAGDAASNIPTQKLIDALIEQLDIDEVFLDAVLKGQSGSCSLIITIASDGKPFIDVVAGKFCTPRFNLTNPRELLELEREMTITGSDLRAMGYPVIDEHLNKTFWMLFILDSKEDRWHVPMLDEEHLKLGQDDAQGNKTKWAYDKARSRAHKFGVVPAVWIRNLNERRKIDGRCTFAGVVDIQLSLDYLASQITRGLYYTADPLLAIGRGEMDELTPVGQSSFDDIDSIVASKKLDRTPGNFLELPAGSNAQLLEITGTAFMSAASWFSQLKDSAIEIISGSKMPSENSQGNPHSGKALDIMMSSLAWLIERQRIAYGNHGYLVIVRILLAGLKEGAFELDGISNAGVDPTCPIKMLWPTWLQPTGTDLLTTITALQLAAGGSVREPRQIAPMDLVIRQTLAALGFVDPGANVEIAMAESTAYEQQKLDAQKEVKAVAPPKAPPAK